MIKACTCKHDYQDRKYGQGMRVHTEDKNGVPRCTVCSGNPLLEKMTMIARTWTAAMSLAPRTKYPGPFLAS